jgi:hypothetical protein
MNAFGQLLHEEDFHCDAHPYRLFVYRADGGIMGRWRCAACQCDRDHEDCLAFSSVDGCLESMKRTITKHHASAHGK